jgi:hypothetical protein
MAILIHGKKLSIDCGQITNQSGSYTVPVHPSKTPNIRNYSSVVRNFCCHSSLIIYTNDLTLTCWSLSVLVFEVLFCVSSQAWNTILLTVCCRFFLRLKYQFLKGTASRRCNHFLKLLTCQVNGGWTLLPQFYVWLSECAFQCSASHSLICWSRLQCRHSSFINFNPLNLIIPLLLTFCQMITISGLFGYYKQSIYTK